MEKIEESASVVVNLKAPPVYKVIVIQLIVTLLVSIGAFALKGEVAAYSVFLGGLICTLSNGYFASKAFRYVGARSTYKIVKSFYQGEAIKLMLIFASFGLVVVYVHPMSMLALFFGFLVVHVSGIIALKKVLEKNY